MDNFCWHNRLHFEYLKAFDQPFELKEIFRSTEKKPVTKAVDLLLLLDTVHSAELPSLSPTGPQVLISPPTLSSNLVVAAESSSGKISIRQHDNFSSKVWAAFQAYWMQELLYNLAEDFISDYLSLIGRIDCTMQSIWTLKESYLKTLFDAVSSRYRRDKAIEKTKASLRKRVIEAEKKFPGPAMLEVKPMPM